MCRPDGAPHHGADFLIELFVVSRPDHQRDTVGFCSSQFKAICGTLPDELTLLRGKLTSGM